MTTTKTEKELAFLHDLFIAPDWGERFAELIDQHVTIPKKGKVLYVALATGVDAIALHERAGRAVDFLCFHANEECLALSRTKARATKDAARFERSSIDEFALP